MRVNHSVRLESNENRDGFAIFDKIMVTVLDEAILMSTHNIHFHDKKKIK